MADTPGIQMGSHSLLPPPHNKNTVENDSTDLLTTSNSSFHEIQPADESPTLSDNHQSTCHTSLTITADDSSPTSLSSVQNRLSFSVILSSLVIILILFISIVFLPLLVVFCLIIRLLQFIRHGQGYYNATHLKLFMRIWICQSLLAVAFSCVIYSSASKYTRRIDGTRLDRAVNKVILTPPISLYLLFFGLSFFAYILPPILCVIIPYHSPFDHVGLYVRDRVLEIIDCLLFWWIETTLVEHIPAIKHHKILGVYTQNGIQVSLFVFIGYNVITLFTCLIVLGLGKLVSKTFHPGITDTIVEHSLGKKYIVYCANGMKTSINFILIALMLLLTWVLYFGSHLNDTTKAKKVLKIGTWTCVSISICSVSWLIKTSVLLLWEATAVYSRLSSRILEAGNQLYFLGLIGRHNSDIFKLQYNVSRKQLAKDDKQTENKGTRKMRLSAFCDNLKLFRPVLSKHAISRISWFEFVTPFYTMLSIVDNHKKSKSDDVDEWAKRGASELNDEEEQVKHSKKVKKLSRKVKKRVRNDLLMQDGVILTIHGIQEVAQYLLSARETLLDDNYTSHILLNLEKGSEDGITIKENLMKQLIKGDEKQHSSGSSGKGRMKHEWDYFEDQLGTCYEEIKLETIKAWMLGFYDNQDKARNNCLFLANLLSSAKEVVGCLNKIISSLLIAATLIMWLLVNGFATTKAFVLIASPLLAATFIFGDTSKSLFQGIMFVYVVHPFDIGDLCVIDENLMEVRTIGVWKTTFLRVSTQTEIMYTNTELLSKNIVNHKTDFDWNDSLELEVTSLDTKQIKELKQKIESHLNAGNKKFKLSHNCVTVLTTGSNIKIAINIQHNVNLISSTYFECVKEKQNRLSDLALDVHDLLEKMKRSTTRVNSTEQTN